MDKKMPILTSAEIRKLPLRIRKAARELYRLRADRQAKKQTKPPEPSKRKLLQDRKRIAVVLLFVAAFVIAITALLPATEISINDSCQIAGPIEKLKSSVQGQHYWAKQLQLLDEEVRNLEALPERIKKAHKVGNDALKENRQFMAELYLQHPELRPTAQQTTADGLRDVADAIDSGETQKMFEQIWAKRISALKSCRPAVLVGH